MNRLPLLIATLCLLATAYTGWGWHDAEARLSDARRELQTVRLTLDGSRTIVRVIDGDTVELDGGQRVRLAGIDTPELSEKIDGEWRKIKDPDPRGIAARDYLRTLEGRRVRLETRAIDTYGRTVGRLILLPDNLYLSDEIKRRGWSGRAKKATP